MGKLLSESQLESEGRRSSCVPAKRKKTRWMRIVPRLVIGDGSEGFCTAPLSEKADVESTWWPKRAA